jgi:amino acid adenylation domain-containing protein
LSPGQERLWYLAKLAPDSPAYGFTRRLTLRGVLDAAALAWALAEIVRRHPVLSTVFAEHGDRPVQRPGPPFSPLGAVDLAALPPARAAAEADRLSAAEARRPLSLEAGRPLRALLVRLGSEEHRLELQIHHIVFDGWSLGVLLRDLAALYRARVSGGAGRAAPAAPGLSYAAFARWQREMLGGERLERLLAHWRQRLRGAPELVELPADRQRLPALSLRGARRSAVLAAPGVRAVASLAVGGEVTPFLALLTVFAALLFRTTRQETVVVGVPVAGRLRREHEEIIGFFVNTLPVRLDRGGDPPFGVLLAAVRDAVLADLAHQDLPFERLVAALRPGRSLSHNPLFQVLFVLQEDAAAGVELPGLALGVEEVDSGASGLDWTFEVAREGGGYRLTLVYSTDLFDAPAIERALAHFETLLAAAAAEPGLRLSALPLLTPVERFQVLTEWNDTAALPAPAGCLHHLVAARVRERPGAVALVHGEERLTYGELWARAEGVAHCLRALGVGPEVRVAVCAERSPDLVAGLLGVLAAGGAYVPVDPAYPEARSAQILDDCGAAVLLTEEKLLPRLPRTGARIAFLDPSATAGRADSSEGLDGGVGGENLAYVIYTSGSLGRPKGVAIRHAAIVARLRWSAGAFSAAEMAGVLAATSVCFDLSVWELFAPLSQGGTVILGGNALELRELPARGDVRLVNTVPSAIAELVAAGALPAGVRTVNLAGEPLPGALVRRIAEEPGGRRVWNLYGPSEDTTYSTGAVMHGAGVPSIGRPLPGTRVYVADPWLAPVPVATPGELLIGGVGLARGYLGRPDLTAERFLPDPFGEPPGARLYRTGDLVRTRQDGSLEFLGRIDHQVKVRGFRIELGEIEEVLREHPAVAEVAVVVREDVPDDRRLVAYVAAAAAEAAALRRFLKSRLPEYMVPADFVLLDALPLTPNGKVDRRNLPALERGAPPGTSACGEGTAARTPFEELIAAIWAEVLGIEQVGRSDDFFALGGHSLKAMQVLSRVRDALRVELPLRRLLEEPTVGALAGAVEAARRAGIPAHRPALVTAVRAGDLPLSFAQQRLWFLDRFEEGRPVYNLASAVRLTGALDVPALAGALREIGRRHETLRTSFHLAGGEGVQRVAPEPRLPLTCEDLAALSAGRRQKHLERQLREEAWRPFDLAAGEPVRARLFRLAPEEHALLLSFHHMVADGWSLRVLDRELGALYAALSAQAGRRPSPLPELPVQYADYAVWQRSWLCGGVLADLLAAAQRRLEGAPGVLELPTDRPRPPVPSGRGGCVVARLPQGVSRHVEAFGRSRGATLFITLLAAFEALLWRWSGQDDLILGFPVAGRDRRETEGLIGCFVNTLVVRQRIAGTMTFAGLLAGMRESFLAAYEGRDLPFERLVEEVVPRRDRGRTPLFQALLTVQEAPLQGADLPGLTLSPIAVPIDYVKCDVTLGAEPGAGGLRLSLSYAADLFDATTAGRMLAHLQALVVSAEGDPERPLEDLPLLGAAEAHQVLREWNDTARTGDGERGVHELFAAQAARSPRAPALVWDGGGLTYEELAARAAWLAGRLRAQGVGPESRVGVCLERSPELVVALLAVLQAGGAYVPLDPAYPAERLRLLLAVTGARLVIAAEGLPEGLVGMADLVRIERGAAAAEPAPDVREGGAGGDHLACVMLTSGSTGRPKAVGITHRNVLRLVRAPAYARLGPREVMLQLAPVSFDASTFEIWGCLLHGGRLVLAPAAVPSLAELGSLLERHGVTTLWLTAGLFHQAAEQADRVLTGVRQLLAGGDALSASHVRRALAAMAARDPEARLVNGYGPTECTTFACCQAFVAADGPLCSVPIGRPIGDTAAYVLDAGLRPLPLGTVGELCLGGAGLARGYLESPERTAERFVPHPLASLPGERVYRTGDRVRWTGRGVLEFLGRLDRQVKVRGFRVEPGEIEAALLAHAEVGEAAVVVRPDRSGDKSLVACVVAAPGCELAPGLLRERLARRLPLALVPSRFCILSALPLTANGKVDARALLAAVERLDGEGEEPGAAGPERVPPRNPVEETLAGFWAALLGRREVGVHDDFFACGGHSLLAIQLASRVRDAFGVELPLRLLFESPTVADLAGVVVRLALEQATAGELEDLLNDLEEPAGSPATEGPGGARLS